MYIANLDVVFLYLSGCHLVRHDQNCICLAAPATKRTMMIPLVNYLLTCQWYGSFSAAGIFTVPFFKNNIFRNQMETQMKKAAKTRACQVVKVN